MFDCLKYFNTSDLLLQFNRKSYNIQPTIWWWIIDYHWLSLSFYSTPAAALVIKTLPVKHDFVLTAVFRFLPEAAACPVLHVSCPQAKRYPPLFSGHLCKRDGIRFSKPFKIVRDIFKSKLKIRPKSRGQTVNNSAKPEAETSWLNQHHYRNIFTSITKSSIRASGAKRGRGLRSPAHRYLSKCAEAGLVLHTQPFILRLLLPSGWTTVFWYSQTQVSELAEEQKLPVCVSLVPGSCSWRPVTRLDGWRRAAVWQFGQSTETLRRRHVDSSGAVNKHAVSAHCTARSDALHFRNLFPRRRQFRRERFKYFKV